MVDEIVSAIVISAEIDNRIVGRRRHSAEQYWRRWSDSAQGFCWHSRCWWVVFFFLCCVVLILNIL
jgi:hypothetical protein